MPFSSSFTKQVFILSLLIHFYFYIVICTEYEVNENDGWKPPKHDDQTFNNWASKNRFKVNDTIHFKYKKDSVLVVTEDEYENCEPLHPQFFSNNGDTVFTLDRPGLFFFISGVTGHCQKGQKMIIKVLEPPPATPPQQSQNMNSTTPNTPDKKNDAALGVAVTSSTIMLLLISAFG